MDARTLHHAPTLALATVLIAIIMATPPALAQGDGAADFTVTVTDDALQVPETLPAGFYTLTVDDRSDLPRTGIEIDRLNDGVELQQVLDAYEAVTATFEGEGDPGAATQRLASLVTAVTGESVPPTVAAYTPGTYLAISSMDPSLHATFEVTEAAASGAAPQPDLTIDMMEFAFDIPAQLPAGPQTWEIRNIGEQVHHMVLFRLNEGATLDDVLAFAETMQGPPPGEEVGYTAILSPEVSNYVTHDLAPGTYAALCFLPDYDTGVPHVALGMAAEFEVVGD